MKRKSTSTLGALHPILFFAGVYIVALFFSIFICSSIFYSCNSSTASISSTKTEKPIKPEIKNTDLVSVK
jgi:hypothetical protein